jgi:hypothetical protein
MASAPAVGNVPKLHGRRNLVADDFSARVLWPHGRSEVTGCVVGDRLHRIILSWA